MSKNQKKRKARKLAEREEELRRWRENKRLYRVGFPWKQLFLLFGSFILVGLLVWLAPKGILYLSEKYATTISGPFGSIEKTELENINYAAIKTNKGDIKLELFKDSAPKTVANFVLLVQDKFYNGIKFHRVIDDFMIQTGDPLSKDDDPNNDGTGGPGYTFADEFNNQTPELVRGVVAMANSGIDTNGSQFFIITTESTPWLDGKHTPFARVIEGMEIADSISQVRTDESDRPLQDIYIETIELS
jgi:cyclophilin family peptidyl-prolyl cis-trans isomerase